MTACCGSTPSSRGRAGAARARRRRRALAAGAALAAALVAAGLACGPRRPDGPPRGLVLVTLDTTRADHLSAYGYSLPTSPNLEKLARDGVRFAAAYSASASTAPSHATLFTGVPPLRHGVVKNGLALPPDVGTLAERLRARGVQTAAVVSSFVLARRFGLGRGFDHYDDAFVREEGGTGPVRWEGFDVPESFDRRADHTTDRALAWLRQDRDAARPFFLFVHYFDPHTPYEAPPPFGARFAPAPGADRLARLVAAYDAEIAFTDAQLGRLLAGLGQLGLADDTLVIVTADHGEGLMQHGVLTHGIFVYESAVHVPLLVRWPAHVPAGRVVETPVAAVDLVPTLAALFGLPPEGETAGTSWLPLLWGEDAPRHGPIFLFRRPYPGGMVGMLGRVWAQGRLFGIRDGRWTYIEGDTSKEVELYDLEADPAQTENLASREPGRCRELAARVAAWREHWERAPAAGRELSPAERKALEALGYVQ